MSSPAATPSIPVPLIQPKYERKTRLRRNMHITDSVPASASVSASDLLRQKSVEALNIKNGKVEYSEQVAFHAYALYKHGTRAIFSHSVGYSSEGDLVLVKDEQSEFSESELAFRRRSARVDTALCLNPSAKRPLTDSELTSTKRLTGNKFKKYPGVKCPKNRRIQNRLRNDHFASAEGRPLYCSVHNGNVSSDSEEKAAKPMFPRELPKQFMHKEEDEQFAELERKGVALPLSVQSMPPAEVPAIDSAEFRFQQLSARIKDELQHAISTGGFMTDLVAELETKFAALIEAGPEAEPLTLSFRDGYGRLLCHGIAAFYKLSSNSEDVDGTRQTIVSRSKKPIALPSMKILELLGKKRSPITPQPRRKRCNAKKKNPPVMVA